MKSSSRTYLYGLDHLRAFAAFLVFFWHAIHRMGIDTSYVPLNPFAGLLEEGYAGVSLFICISGFVFTVLTYGREIDYFVFLRNRFLRIFPLFFLITLFAVSSDNLDKGAVLLFFNLLGGGVAFGSWTLAIEFQFYMAYPFIRQHLLHDSTAKTVASCGALILFFFFFRCAFFTSNGHNNFQEIAYETIFGRADQFILGILAGYFFIRFRNITSPRVYLVSAIIFIMSAIAVVTFYNWFNASGGFYNRPTYPSPSKIWAVFTTIEGVFWSSLIGSYCMISSRFNNLPSRLFAHLGEVSYSTYLIHMPAFRLIHFLYSKYIHISLTTNEFTSQALIAVLFYYPFIIFFSSLSYYFIEKPFLYKRRTYLTTSPQTNYA